MPFYESTFVVRQDVSTQEVEKITEQFAAVISEFKGSVVKKEYWGLLNLAYKIKKNRKGHYMMLALDVPVDCIAELERKYKLHNDVIRYLTIKVDAISEDPSPMMKRKDSREKAA